MGGKCQGSEWYLPSPFFYQVDYAHPIQHTAPAPNFISNIFFLTIAMSHYGYLKTVRTYGDVGKQIDEVERHLEFINGDGSWRGVRSSFLFISNDIVKSMFRAPSMHRPKLELHKLRMI